MARWGNCDFGQLQAWADRLEQVDLDAFTRSVAAELAARLLRMVKKRTPVGVKPEWVDPDILQQYWSGYTGGTLRDAWKVLPVEKHGNDYIVTIVNNTEYVSYVEYGHRQKPGKYVPALGKRLKESWVPGRFMLRLSLEDLEKNTPKWVEKKVQRFLEEVFENGQPNH